MRFRACLWALEDKLWSRRSYQQLQRLNAGDPTGIEQGEVLLGSDTHQRLLWFAPATPTRRDPPVVFFIHGGGWQSGDPAWHRFVGRHFAQRGFFAVVVGYRLAPQFVFPDPLIDVATAVQTGRALAKERGWHGRSVLIGQSAGAHLAALLVYGGAYLLPAKIQQPVGGLVLLGGPLVFAAGGSSELELAIRTLVGPAGQVSSADPIRYVTGDEAAPVLCVHGAKDYLVPPEHSVAFIRRVNMGGGNKGELLLLRRYHHADLLSLLYEPSAEADHVQRWIAARA